MNQAYSHSDARLDAALPALAAKSDIADVLVAIANMRAERAKKEYDKTTASFRRLILTLKIRTFSTIIFFVVVESWLLLYFG